MFRNRDLEHPFYSGCAHNKPLVLYGRGLPPASSPTSLKSCQQGALGAYLDSLERLSSWCYPAFWALGHADQDLQTF